MLSWLTTRTARGSPRREAGELPAVALQLWGSSSTSRQGSLGQEKLPRCSTLPFFTKAELTACSALGLEELFPAT